MSLEINIVTLMIQLIDWLVVHKCAKCSLVRIMSLVLVSWDWALTEAFCFCMYILYFCVCVGGQTKVLVSLPQCIKSSCYAVSPAVISNFILSHCCRTGLSAPSIPPLAWGPTWPFLPGGRGRLWLLMLCYFWSTVNTHYIVNITKIT